MSAEVATGHAQLPQAVIQSLKLQQHGRLRLQSITSATQLHPRLITLHPVPHPPADDADSRLPAQQHHAPTELSQQDLKRLLATWLTAQASMLSTAEEGAHVPVQQSTLVQLTSDSDDAAEQQQQQQSRAYKIFLKQAPSLRSDPAASYALLSAADLAPGSSSTVSQGGPVVPVQYMPMAQPASAQLVKQQAAMLSSSETLHAAASTALKHLLPLLAPYCR